MIDGRVIAVIDDDESVRAALASLLRSTGLAVNLFHGAEEFLRSPWGPDAACLIVDVRMPGVSGLDLQELLVARGHLLPIIFISAHADAGERDRALAAGALGILSKPFAADELFQYIDCALKQDKLFAN
ncbi:MAG: response regulator [Geminicoccaceae bacterium]